LACHHNFVSTAKAVEFKRFHLDPPLVSWSKGQAGCPTLPWDAQDASVRTSMVRKTESLRPSAHRELLTPRFKNGGDDLSLAQTVVPFLRSARALALFPQKN
jgi:hypothetical protein